MIKVDERSQKILRLIKEKGVISRADISRFLRIRPATTIEIVRELERDAMIKKVGWGESTGGRPPLLFTLNEEFYFSLGVCISDSHLSLGLVDLKGEVIKKTEAEAGENIQSREELLRKLSEMINTSISSLGTKGRILGIGMGIPGLIDKRGRGVFYARYPWWREIPFKERLEDSFHIPVFVENDTRTLTLAEKWFGKGKGKDNFFYLDAGEEVALGIFLNGNLYRGSGGSAGEIGHTIISLDGPLCGCGKRGCLEAFIKTFMEKARYEEVITYLGIALADVIQLFNPSLIVVGGSFVRRDTSFLELLKKTCRSYSFSRPRKEAEISLSQVKDGRIKGAAIPVLEKIFGPEGSLKNV